MSKQTFQGQFSGPLVIIGASAGGLDPIQAFFENAEVESGICYVLIQHLSPNFKSHMSELLGRKSPLRSVVIADGMRLEENKIFLCTPSSFIQIEDGRFRVLPYDSSAPQPRMPIDGFLKSAASGYDGTKIAVILSGAGADGSKGAVPFHDAGGHVLVQKPETADFPSMPDAVIATAPVDQILPAADLPEVIKKIIQGEMQREEEAEDLPQDPIHTILRLIETKHKIDFSQYKQQTVLRRINRRLSLGKFKTIEDYRDFLLEDEDGLDELYADLLIGVTEFYRDPEAYASLRKLVLPSILRAKDEGQMVRVWVAGCATGEEAYSIAIELNEAIKATGKEIDYRIIASDVHKRSIDFAAAGIYPEEAVRNVPAGLRDQYFTHRNEDYIVSGQVRRRIVFSNHNTLSDPPFLDIDLITCRNVLIYFNEKAQRQALSRFIFSLKKDGFVFLGPSETLGSYKELFTDVDARWRIYRKTTAQRVAGEELFLGGARDILARIQSPPEARPVRRRPLVHLNQIVGGKSIDRTALISGYDALLKRYAPSSILVDTEGNVLTWFGIASIYVDTMSNMAEWRVDAILHPDLQYVIYTGIERVKNNIAEQFERQVSVKMHEAVPHVLNVSIEALSGGASDARLILVHLARINAPDAEDGPVTLQLGDDEVSTALHKRVLDLERDLRLTEESLQYVTESLEASAEELQSANEELQASNEELQASNEELQSSNEELHAVNEELSSVTEEYERKQFLMETKLNVAESILSDLGYSYLKLTEDGLIEEFSDKAAKLLGLELHDVGRPITVIGRLPNELDWPQLLNPSETNDAKSQLEATTHEITIGKDCVSMRILSGRALGLSAQSVVLLFSAGRGA